VRTLADAGAEVEEVEIEWPASQAELSDLWCRLITPLNLETIAGLREFGHDFLGAHRDELPEAYLRWMDLGLRATSVDISRDQALRTACFDAIQVVFAGHDLLVSSTLGALPPLNSDVRGETIGPTEIDGVAVDPLIGWTLTFPFNFSGHPAASVPAGLAPGGLPVGLHVVGPLRDDVAVLAAGAALERSRPWQENYEMCEARSLA
jgi:amidase/aspartyl-tRNA(Asn)/glutamyl-tRNA(Gln) amidotransferase subunit A